MTRRTSMKRATAVPLVAALALSLAATGCAAGGTPAPAATATAKPSSTAAATTPAPASHLPAGGEPVTLDPADFSADITHPLWPMKPRTRWIYRELEANGTVTDGVVVATTKT
jgi:ABC-type transport system substrate-binding protein